MHKNKLYHYLPNIALTILLSFLFLIFIVLCLVKFVVINPRTYSNAMYDCGVDETAYNEINSYFDRQYAYTGVKADVFKASVKRVDVSSAMFAYVDSTFDYMRCKTDKLPDFEFDFTPLETAIHDDYVKWAENNSVAYDSVLKEKESTTISNAERLIKAKLDIMMLSVLNTSGGISTTIHNYYKYVNILIVIFAVIVAAFVFAIWFVNRKHKRNVYYWTSVSIFSAAMLLIIPTAMLSISHFYDRLAIKNDSIYNALTQSLYNITDQILICGIIMLIISAIVMFLYSAIRKNMFKVSHIKSA